MATDGEEGAHPASAEEWNTLGNTRYRGGDIAGAEEAYRRAIELDPGLFKPYGNLGTVLAGRGKRRDAVALFEKAIELNPKSHRFRTNLGNALRDLGRRDEAIEAYRASIAVQPSHAALHNLAVLLAEPGALEEAIPLFEEALACHPNAYETHVELGLALERIDEEVNAVRCLERALSSMPARELVNLGLPAVTAVEKGVRIDRLLLQTAMRAENATPALAVVGRRHKRRDLEGARRLADELTRAFPREPRVWIALAMVLVRDFGDSPAAAEVLLKGRDATDGADELALSVAFVVTAGRGNASRALAEVREIFARGDATTSSLEMALFLAQNCEEVDGKTLLEMHLEWAQRIPKARPLVPTRQQGARIRVGYLSADLRRHSVARFIEPVLRAHDRQRFEVVCYSASTRVDRVTERLRGLDLEWRDVVALDDFEVAKLIASDGIDVLVELGGHMSESRLTVLSHRPAPVQISYLGYPGTTGLPDVDFRIADPLVEPPGDADLWSSERILRLPESAWCFEPPEDAPSTERVGEGPQTFGSFNALAKISDSTLAAWAEILRKAPETRLRIKATHAPHPSIRERFAQAFTGIDPGRVELLDRVRADKDHLTMYREIDVALDTYPYNGTTTTCEALWMGVPVVTYAGERHASRVGVSLLRNAGLKDLVAKDWRAYVDTAIRLIRDKNRLTLERATLRQRIRASSLGDPQRHTRALEAAYLHAIEIGRRR